MNAILIFDIDWTLIHTDGAGSRAMTRVFARLFGLEDAFAAMEFAGRTDGAILRECFGRHSLLDAGYAERLERFHTAYLEALAEELAVRNGGALPGVQLLLEALSVRSDVRLGLGTGNFRDAAELKLRSHGLWSYFLDGGFADDSEDRAEVIAAAIRRLRRAGEAEVAIYVLGDTIHDIAAAKANGALAIGVATGRTNREALRAAGADLVLDNLVEVEPLLQLLGPT